MLKTRSENHKEFVMKEREAFNNASELMDASYENFIGRMKRDKVFERYKKFLKNKKSVLDVGCGSGACTRRIYEYSANIFGCDISENMLRIAKQKCLHASFAQADILDIPFKDASFDLIFVADVIHHLLEQDYIYEELKRLLMPGGCLIIDEPNRLARFSLHHIVKKIKNVVPQDIWNRFFAKEDTVKNKVFHSPVEKLKMKKNTITPHGIDPVEVRKLLDGNGFNIIRSGYYNACIVGVPSYVPENIAKLLLSFEINLDGFFRFYPRANTQAYIIAKKK